MFNGAANLGESQMRQRDMQKQKLKRPRLADSVAKYGQIAKVAFFMRSLVYQGFQDFSVPLRVRW
jgi:hypothetical protein